MDFIDARCGFNSVGEAELFLTKAVNSRKSVGDFDGDHKSDIAVYRDGMWFILRSLDQGVTATGWGGLAQDVPVPGDFDGDGETDIAVYRDGTLMAA